MKKILLVDANVDFLYDEKEIIQEFNDDAECIAFTNPLDALEYVNKYKDIDILITDYELPNLNGFEFIKKVIKINETKFEMIVFSNQSSDVMEQLTKSHNLDKKVRLEYKTNCWFLLDVAE